MSSFENFDINTDPDTLAAAAFDYLSTKMPGWVPNDGNLETWMIEAMARMVAQARDIAAQVPRAVYRQFGNSVMGIAPVEDSFASVTSTWTARDAAGYTVTSGTQVGIRTAGDVLVGFEVLADVTIPPGSSVTAAGEVVLIAIIAGTEANSIGGTVEPVDSLAWVLSAVTVGTSSGGTEAESDDDYLSRLSQELQLLSPRPILARDFAILAQRVAGVERALAIDGYDPTNDSYFNERMVAVAGVDTAGEAVSAPVKQGISDLLEAEREQNFIINVIDPTYTSIDVTFAFTTMPGQEPSSVEDAAITAVKSYLSPAGWGLLDSGDEWRNVPVVRYLEVASVITNVPGVDFIVTLQIARTGQPFSNIDVPLSGPVSLPRAGTVQGAAA